MNETLLDGQTEDNLNPQELSYEDLIAKYGDENGITKKVNAADNHIKILETRMDQLRGEYERVLAESKAAPKLQDLLDRLENLETNPASRETNPLSNEDNRTVIDETKIDSLLTNKLEQLRTQEKQQQNFNSVFQKAKETLGDNFKTILKQRADSLALSDAEVDSMARNNPNLFYKTFDITTPRQESFQAPVTSQVRQSNFNGGNNQKRTMSYYNELAKKNPRIYFDPKIAVQMDKDAQELGSAFFDA